MGDLKLNCVPPVLSTLVRASVCSDWTSDVARPSNCGESPKVSPTTRFSKGILGTEGNDLKRVKAVRIDRK